MRNSQETWVSLLYGSVTITEKYHVKLTTSEAWQQTSITHEKIWTCITEAFVITNHVQEKGMIGQAVKAQYWLPGSGHTWWLKLSETLHDLGFTRSHGDSATWYRENSEVSLWV
jgi:hypothetical protein